MSVPSRSAVLVAAFLALLGCASARVIEPPPEPPEEIGLPPPGMRWATPLEKSYLSGLVARLSENTPDDCGRLGLVARSGACGAERQHQLPLASVMLPPRIDQGERLDTYIELAPTLCLGQISARLPDGWTWVSGPDAELHGGQEWSEAYDGPGLEARLVVAGPMDDGIFCGRRLTIIRWGAARSSASD